MRMPQSPPKTRWTTACPESETGAYIGRAGGAVAFAAPPRYLIYAGRSAGLVDYDLRYWHCVGVRFVEHQRHVLAVGVVIDFDVYGFGH